MLFVADCGCCVLIVVGVLADWCLFIGVWCLVFGVFGVCLCLLFKVCRLLLAGFVSC